MGPNGILFDLDGVLYSGAGSIPGAAAVIEWVRQQQIPHLFLTNTTSRSRSAIVDKLAGLEIEARPEELLTPAVVAAEWLQEHARGPVALLVPCAATADFQEIETLPEDAESGASAVVVGDLGEAWDFTILNRAFRLLMEQPRPPLVALGLTRYWQGEDGRLRLDAGPFVRALEYATGVTAVVTGKPAPGFFRSAAAMLGTAPEALVMIGDDIRGDIDGAQRAGIKGLLVKTGKFRPGDLSLGITPGAVLESVADLPQWWTSTDRE